MDNRKPKNNSKITKRLKKVKRKRSISENEAIKRVFKNNKKDIKNKILKNSILIPCSSKSQAKKEVINNNEQELRDPSNNHNNGNKLQITD